MDEKILKWTAVGFTFLTVLVCVCLFCFPDMERYLADRRRQREEEELRTAREEAEKEAAMTAQIEALMEQRSAEGTGTAGRDQGEEGEHFSGEISSADSTDGGHGINMDLPAGVKPDEVDIENDYVERMIRVSFPGQIRDYFSTYHVWGSSDGIDSMTYYQSGGKGVLELETDGVYELKYAVTEKRIGLTLLDPHKLYERIVVVDAGHGGAKTGAEREGVLEKDINLAIVKALNTRRKNKKTGYFYTRLKDQDVSLEQRVGLVNALGADLFISIHNNSTASTSAAAFLQGTQVLYEEKGDRTKASRKLAQICLEEMTESLKSHNLGLLPGDDIYIIRNSKAPAALIEVGFMTYGEERDKLQTQEYQKKAARAVEQAVERAFKEGL